MAGDKFHKFYFRDPKNAERFKPGVTPPRLNFNGFVEFKFAPGVWQLVEANGTYREQISSLLQTAKLPSVTFNTQIKNQYNIKRVVNTSVDYAPVEINVIDTVNNEWLILLMKYFSYMYMNPRNKTSSGPPPSPNEDGTPGPIPNERDADPKGYDSSSSVWTRPSSFMTDTFDSNAAGLDIHRDLTGGPSFIDQIRIIVYHGGTGTEYILFKPTITQFDLGQIDYTSTDFRQFSMTFEYENFTVNNKFNFQLNEDDLARFETIDAHFEFDATDNVRRSNMPWYQTSTAGMLGDTDRQRPRDVQPLLKRPPPESTE